MPVSRIVLITGLPCTGKTTLGRRIARQFQLPFLFKDEIKELLFDTLGWKDREWSKKLGAATYDLLYYFLEVELAAGRSLVVESNFSSQFATSRFLALKERYSFDALQILCISDGDVLYERFVQRSENGERHPGHVDHLNYQEFAETLRNGWLEPLEIGGTLIQVDTTDYLQIDYERIYTAVQELLL